MRTEQTSIPDETGTRQKIIDTARSEFAEHGLAGARVERIAKTAGVNKAMIYYHFHSKEYLYESVVKEFFQEIFRQILARTSEGKTLDQFLLAALETHIHAYQTSPEFVKILLRELASPNESLLNDLATTIRGSQFPATVVARLQQGMAEGEYRKIDPQQAMMSIITMSIGYLLLAPLADRIWGIEDRTAFLDKRKHAIVDLFLHGVMAR
ncbi:MAG: TetR/AcrR family transcriptional regulator [candidate division Zixibacteria bacterium]|nr:TetR/AcrR family transcriptional regulator [candidate division Zixibacteria bacterium]